MKNSNKLQTTITILAIVLLILTNSSSIYAQKSHFTVSLSPIFPLSLKTDASIGLLSGKICYSYDLTKKISWNLSAAFNKFGSKTVTPFNSTGNYESKLGYFPVTTGFQFYFKDDGTRPYFVANGGYYFPVADFEKGGFGILSGLGIEIPMKNNKNKVDISLVYNSAFGGTTKEYVIGSTHTKHYSWASYIALNVGMVFGK